MVFWTTRSHFGHLNVLESSGTFIRSNRLWQTGQNSTLGIMGAPLAARPPAVTGGILSAWIVIQKDQKQIFVCGMYHQPMQKRPRLHRAIRGSARGRFPAGCGGRSWGFIHSCCFCKFNDNAFERPFFGIPCKRIQTIIASVTSASMFFYKLVVILLYRHRAPPLVLVLMLASLPHQLNW